MTVNNEFKTIKCVLNVITLFNLIKQNIKDTVNYKNNELNLIDINENVF